MAERELLAHLQEKTMLDGEKLPSFDSHQALSNHYLPQLSRDELEKVNAELIGTLDKMREEREDRFGKKLSP